ncbi:MAG: GNAT family N-acetyltransferase [Lachnospiraceae bacterium]|nr:GNAT family N-acetyltransferase [Lachnospiraceae bacterium]
MSIRSEETAREAVELRINEITVDEYLKLRDRVGWKKLSRQQAQLALDNSLVTVGAYLADQPIGMGRLVGDRAVICYIQDLIIPPQAQGYGVGSVILKQLMAWAEQMRIPGTEMMLDLMCAKGRESFYEQHGFLSRPTDALGPGMIQYLNDKGEIHVHSDATVD